MRNWVNVSCRGDDDYIERLRAFAKARNLHLGVIVRNALDNTYGSNLDEQQTLEGEPAPIFFAKNGAYIHQTELESDNHATP